MAYSISPLFVLSLWFFSTLLSAAEPPAPQSLLLLPLTHSVLSKTHQNHQQQESQDDGGQQQLLLKSASLRSAARFRHHRRRDGRRHHQGQVSLPLSPGSDYTLSFSVGGGGGSSSSNNNTVVEVYMDTGSDLVWFPCAPFECILCEGKPNYPLAPGSLLHFPTTAAVPCHSPSCSAAHSSSSSSDLCAVAGCPLETIETSTCSSSFFPCPPFYYAYGDGSLVARLRRDHLSLPAAAAAASSSSTHKNPPPPPVLLHLPDFTFGCAHTTLAEPVGVAGFGRGVLSLPAQLARLSPPLGKQFSYCLVSHSFMFDSHHGHGRPSAASPLILGRQPQQQEEEQQPASSSSSSSSSILFVYTPMLDNPKHPYFYTVGLDAVVVGGRRIRAAANLRRVDGEGNGGVVVDSGTTFTILPPGTHARIVREFHRRMLATGRLRAPDAEAETGLSPCYYEPPRRGSSGGVPSMVLQFAGNASVALPTRNYYLSFTFSTARGGGGGSSSKKKKKVGCLMLMSSEEEEESSGGGGPAGTLGNFQQQEFEVVYDLEDNKLGFARRQCAALWDSLSRAY